MTQVARNLTDAIDGFLRETRFLIHDRDPLFSKSFRTTLRADGVKTVKLPPKSPNLNPTRSVLFAPSKTSASVG